jgi:2-iminobutanoate/2-iminopropanoate deaminase
MYDFRCYEFRRSLLSSESRRYINLPNRAPSLPFSDAVLVGDTLYISGRIGIDPATGEAPESIDAELELLFGGFRAVLRQAGMTMDDLVWVQVHSPDVSLWQRFNAAYVKVFSREFPARAFLGSGKLLLRGRFEMLGIAVKDPISLSPPRTPAPTTARA